MENSFYKNAILYNQTLKTSTLQQILFPDIEISNKGDKHFHKVWNLIDSSKDFICFSMYHFDETYPANITLHKLTQAAKRGVNVVFMHDQLVSKVDEKLLKEFENAGGKYHRLGPFYKVWNILNREYFKRSHEKVIYSDNKFAVGSANISGDYAHKQFGTSFFWDINVYGENTCLDDVRSYIVKNANHHEVKFHEGMSNEDYIKNIVSKKYPDSQYSNPTHKVIKSFHPDQLEIHNVIMNSINNAKKSIKIITPYYYPVSRIDKALIAAAKRGVDVEVITAKKRDIPAYMPFKNWHLLKSYVNNDIKVYESDDLFIHMKAFQIDNHDVTFGSFNIDKWSWSNNNEVNFYAQDQNTNQIFNKYYQEV